MKTLRNYLLLTLTILALASCHNDLEDTDVWNAIFRNETQQNARIAALENLCREQNTNIESLQTLIEAVENNYYISGITPIVQDGDTIGWNINYGSDGGITIYNGKDGINASSPIIGVKQDTDGVYYWTLNGDWLLDDNGQKLRVTGNDGATATDGVTPQLKIDGDDWYVSYDNGTTWTYAGQATGNKGDKGDTGDSMFQSVTYDAAYVYFTLNDGTIITIARGSSGSSQGTVTIANGAIQAAFSVSDSKKVYFSIGNMLYDSINNVYEFASKQFYYSKSGYGNCFASKYNYGVYESIKNGGNAPLCWRTLTNDEWNYLFNTRTDALQKWTWARIEGTDGLVILPDDWELPQGGFFYKESYNNVYASNYYTSTNPYLQNVYSEKQWLTMQNAGAIFLPTHYYGSTDGFIRWSVAYSQMKFVTGIGYMTDYYSLNFPTAYTVSYDQEVFIRLVQDIE